MEWANSYGACWFHCACQCIFRGCLFNVRGVGALNDDGTKTQGGAAPGSTATMLRDIRRAAREGHNAFGWVHNSVGGLISKNWGFGVREIMVPKTKVVVS